MIEQLFWNTLHVNALLHTPSSAFVLAVTLNFVQFNCYKDKEHTLSLLTRKHYYLDYSAAGRWSEKYITLVLEFAYSAVVSLYFRPTSLADVCISVRRKYWDLRTVDYEWTSFSIQLHLTISQKKTIISTKVWHWHDHLSWVITRERIIIFTVLQVQQTLWERLTGRVYDSPIMHEQMFAPIGALEVQRPGSICIV